MGIYQRRIVPLLLHAAMRQAALRPYRRRIVGAAAGRVLEIGVGSGINLPLYGPGVSRVIGLDPSPQLLRMAHRRGMEAQVQVDLLEGTAEALPFDTASLDTIVTTWVLCSIPDIGRALAEMRRVLKSGGNLLFVEHGRAPEAGVARWQDRLDPLWNRVSGGCHINRKIDDLIAGSGFRIETMTNPRISGPRTHTFFYEGHARPA